MRQAVRNLVTSVCVLMMLPLFAMAQEGKPKPSSLVDQPSQSTTGAAFKDLAQTWWLWAGIIAILGLLGLLYYLRNKTDDD